MATTRVHDHHDDDDTLALHHSCLGRLEALKAPHGCLNGYVYIGHMVEDEDGDEVEVIEAIVCKRCQEAA